MVSKSLKQTIGSASLAAVFLFAIPVMVLRVHSHFMQVAAKKVENTPKLVIYREENGAVKMLRNYAPVVSNDTLRISYDAAGRKFGVILSVDGSGAVVCHFPQESTPGRALTRLEQGGEQHLPSLFELDSAQLFERFYFLTSNDSIDAADVLEKCVRYFREGGAYAASRIRTLPKSIEQTTLQFKKD